MKPGTNYEQMANDALRSVVNHYKDRPIRYHLLVWLVVGACFGMLLAPTTRPITLFSFAFSGVIMCSFLSIPTYPTSDNAVSIFICATTGTLMMLVMRWWAYPSSPNTMLAFGTIVGALIAGTCMPLLLVWRGMFHGLRRLIATATAK